MSTVTSHLFIMPRSGKKSCTRWSSHLTGSILQLAPMTTLWISTRSRGQSSSPWEFVQAVPASSRTWTGLWTASTCRLTQELPRGSFTRYQVSYVVQYSCPHQCSMYICMRVCIKCEEIWNGCMTCMYVCTCRVCLLMCVCDSVSDISFLEVEINIAILG